MSNWNIIERKFPQDKVQALKKEYARILVKCDGNKDLAFQDYELDVAFEGDIACKLYATNHWWSDEEVKNYVTFYQSEGLGAVLPTKAQLAREILKVANTSYNPRDKLLALRDFADLMGYNQIELETETVQNTQNVILIADNGSDLTWEEKLKSKQHSVLEEAQRLIEDD